MQADRERYKKERADADALLAEEAGVDALYGGMDEPASAPGPALASAPAKAAEKVVQRPEPAAKVTASTPAPAATAAPTPAAISEGLPPSTTENVGIVGSKEAGGKTFYDIHWTDEAGTVVRALPRAHHSNPT
eukprot:COSAG02_NODE_602_length_19711_cov_20.882674_7_plen_133_part_00